MSQCNDTGPRLRPHGRMFVHRIRGFRVPQCEMHETGAEQGSGILG